MPSCDYTDKYIEAHHIKRVADYPELVLDNKNGITLCRKCHKSIKNKEKDFELLFYSILEKYNV